MSQTSTIDSKEQIREATDIVELIGSSLTLRREGRQYRGICPWHDDTRPSLQVNPERQTWKCWVCDVGGDIFSFVMKRDGLTFPEALEMLADRAGISLHRSGSTKQQNNKKRLYDVAAWAEALYHKALLDDPIGAPGRDYLKQRNISQELIEQFHLGFAPNDWTWLLRHAQDASISSNDLAAIGLVAISSRTEKPYDRFKGRVLFPIRDAQRRAIAMGGRILPIWESDNPAKYINSPESPLFSKSHSLYAIDIAKEYRPQSGDVRSLIVMEGYTDCLMAHQHGFSNCVACLGTALNQHHVQLLSRYAERITLILDGDAAGHAAADRALNLFLSGGLELRILTLPDGLDPCDFLETRGADAFSQAIQNAPDALDHKIKVATSGNIPEVGTHQANRALEDILATMAQAPALQKSGDSEHKLREDATIARLAKDFHVPEDSVRQRLLALRSSRENKRSQQVSQNTNTRSDRIEEPWEQELLEIILQDPEVVLKCAESIRPDELRDPIARDIYERAITFAREGTTPSFSQLLIAFDSPTMKNILTTLDERGQDRGGNALAKQLPDLISSFHARNAKSAQRTLMAEINDTKLGEDQKLEVLTEIIANEKKRYGQPPR